ncbi:LORF2 protein, partial [Crocuta crocuta]
QKRCSTSFTIRELQSKATVEYHYTPIEKNGKIKNTRNNKLWQGCGENGPFLYCWWECKLVPPLWITVWLFLKKLKIELPYDPVRTLLGIYPNNMKTLIGKDICTPMFIEALFTIAKL